MMEKLTPPNGGHLRTAAGKLLEDGKIKIVYTEKPADLKTGERVLIMNADDWLWFINEIDKKISSPQKN